MSAKRSKNGTVQGDLAKQTVQSPAEKIESVPAAQSPQKGGPAGEPLTRKDTVMVLLYTLLLFFAMAVQTGTMALILCALALVLCIGKTPLNNFRVRFCVPVLGLLAFAVMNGAAAIYSPFDSYAVAEFYKFIAVFSLAVILLARFDRRHVPGLLWGFASVGGFMGVVSMDGACGGAVFSLYNAFTSRLGYSLDTVAEEAVTGSRVLGIYADANVTACLFAMTLLIALYLLSRADTVTKKLCAALLCGVSAVPFFLSLSRGAIGFFAIALVIWLAAAPGEERLKLFFLFVCGAAATLCCSALILRFDDQTGTVTLLLMLLCGALIFALDRFLVGRLAAVTARHTKLALGTVAVMLLLCVGYGIAAVTVTGPVYFEGQTRLVREVSLKPGAYTVSIEGEGLERAGAFVVEERITGEWVFLANGSAGEDLTFTVPEDLAGHLLIGVEGREGVVLERLALSDGTELPLRHVLIPKAVENRIFDATTKNMEQRVQFFKDAWTLFTQSPLIGHGLGSSEGLYRSVQPFYYESKYVHNHILQVMSDMGLLGLIGFAALLLGSGWLLLNAVRKEKDGLSAMLLAVWVLMNGHSLMEINFSVRGFACLAYALLLLPVLLYARPLLREENTNARKVARLAGAALLVCFCVYEAVFGGLLMRHRSVMKEQAAYEPYSQVSYMNKLRDFIRRDVFVQEENKLTYVAYTNIWELEEFRSQSEKYVRDLRSSGTYSACSGLARYEYLPRGQWEDLFTASREGLRQVASSPDGWNLQVEFYRTEVLPAMGEENIETFLSGVTALAEQMDAYNEGRMEPVVLTETNQRFLTAAKSAVELPSDAAWQVLNILAAPAE